jgi:hypothetical protein
VQKATARDPAPAFVVVRSKLDLAADDPFNFGDTLQRIRHCDVMSVSAFMGDGVDAFVARLCEICRERLRNPPQPQVQLEPPREVSCRCG